MSLTPQSPPRGGLAHLKSYPLRTDNTTEQYEATSLYPTTPTRGPKRGRKESDATMVGSPQGPLRAEQSPLQPPAPPHERPSMKSRENSERPSYSEEVAANNPDYRASDWKKHFVACTGEFVGTFLFLWFALAGTSYAVNTDSTLVSSYYASIVFGISLLANAWVFYRISGGLFNPAVTLGLVISGQLPPLRGLLFLPAQILAGICASALVECMFPDDLSAVTRLSNDTSVVRGLFLECILTALLTATVLFLAAEKHKTTFIAPVGIGLAFFSAELVGGSLNPARSFGPDVATRDFPGYHWIYWAGPCLGALLASGYYRFAKYMNYEEANPGQDKTHPLEEV